MKKFQVVTTTGVKVTVEAEKARWNAESASHVEFLNSANERVAVFAHFQQWIEMAQEKPGLGITVESIRMGSSLGGKDDPSLKTTAYSTSTQELFSIAAKAIGECGGFPMHITVPDELTEAYLDAWFAKYFPSVVLARKQDGPQ
jgi:hypothetical protein